MNKTQLHQLWEGNSVKLLKAIRREMIYNDRFEEVEVINEIIKKKKK
jgi:hypothetical protein